MYHAQGCVLPLVVGGHSRGSCPGGCCLREADLGQYPPPTVPCAAGHPLFASPANILALGCLFHNLSPEAGSRPMAAVLTQWWLGEEHGSVAHRDH